MIYIRFFYSGFPLPNSKQNPKGRRAARAAPLGRRRRRRLVVLNLAVETQNIKKPTGNMVFLQARPNFWPQIEKPTLGGADP